MEFLRDDNGCIQYMTSYFNSLKWTRREVYDLLMDKEKLSKGITCREPIQEWLLENDAFHIAKLHRDCGMSAYKFNNFWISEFYYSLLVRCKEFFLEDYKADKLEVYE